MSCGRPKIEIDEGSGFCNGVVTAIRKAEEELDVSGKLFCLGDIVHNSSEVERLGNRGLVTINHDDMEDLHGVKVLFRAHGEPPSTYLLAERNDIEVIDATCPVVLMLQRRIKSAYDEIKREGSSTQIVIYGKNGHAEVNGLVAQTNGEAVVVQNVDELDKVDLSRDILLYSQTTKPLGGFGEIIAEIKRRKTTGSFRYFDTICRQVANRMPKIRQFASTHEVVIFVSGRKSSNGKALYEECRSVNSRSYFVEQASEIDPTWICDAATIGVCGATSTPAWLMQEVKRHLEKIADQMYRDECGCDTEDCHAKDS